MGNSKRRWSRSRDDSTSVKGARRTILEIMSGVIAEKAAVEEDYTRLQKEQEIRNKARGEAILQMAIQRLAADESSYEVRRLKAQVEDQKREMGAMSIGMGILKTLLETERATKVEVLNRHGTVSLKHSAKGVFQQKVNPRPTKRLKKATDDEC